MHFWSVPLNPTPNGGVIHGQAPLSHQFLQIPETQGKPAIPPHTGHNNDWLELALAEQRRPTGSHAANLPDPQMQHFRLATCASGCFTASHSQTENHHEIYPRGMESTQLTEVSAKPFPKP
jgi:hypothetical protein